MQVKVFSSLLLLTFTLSESQKSVTQYLADSGADLIIGSHPHLLQSYGEVTAEDGRTVPVVYSMGNFCSSMAELTLNRYNIILRAEIERCGEDITIADLTCIPCCIFPETENGSYVITPVWQEEGLIGAQRDELAAAQAVVLNTLGGRLPMAAMELAA